MVVLQHSYATRRLFKIASDNVTTLIGRANMRFVNLAASFPSIIRRRVRQDAAFQHRGNENGPGIAWLPDPS
jgi:hypothetical protein